MIQLGNLDVSDEDLAVIAHVVHNETPEAWATRAFNHLGTSSVVSKIARHRASYLAAKNAPGYQTASEKTDERRDRADAQAAAATAKRDQDKTARDARLNALPLDPAVIKFIKDDIL